MAGPMACADASDADASITAADTTPTPPATANKRTTQANKKKPADKVTPTGTDIILSFEFSGEGEGQGMYLEIAGLIVNLKTTITQQSSIIENLRAELKEIKSEQQTLQNQNAETQVEL